MLETFIGIMEGKITSKDQIQHSTSKKNVVGLKLIEESLYVLKSNEEVQNIENLENCKELNLENQKRTAYKDSIKKFLSKVKNLIK